MILVMKKLIFNKVAEDLVKLGIIKKSKDRDDGRYEVACESSRHRFGESKYYGRFSSEGADFHIDLTALTKKETKQLMVIVENGEVHGCRIMVADILKYLKASDDGVVTLRARTCKQAAWMLEKFIAELPHHTIFSEDEYGGKSHSGYYVGDVEYVPETKGSSGDLRSPEYCQIRLYYVIDDVRKKANLTLYRGDCLNMTCLEILDKAGYVQETPKLMEKLKHETERYYRDIKKIGEQHIAIGYGLLDLDDEMGRRGSRGDKIKLDHFNEARVVIDVLYESDSSESRAKEKEEDSPDPYRWHAWNMRFHTPSEDETVRHLEADENTVEPVDVDIPVHPLVPCFDLKRHQRLKIHINNLTSYQYDESVSESLVLPDRDWKMINLLVDHSSNTFRDIVSNKGQSMNVLSVGPPGTGKTATAEVFAEFKKRPLYTVQCSQLGIDAESVEKHLSVAMQRANRWDAIMLLDEADVYIRKRGEDLNQNAIVGAFLRVLEYASCVLFMTTNLEDQVDDAITSRCIAKLHYTAPTMEDQARIWRILADLNELSMTDKEIGKVVKDHPTLTGRDVKNLLKLASFAASKENKAITKEIIEYALQFKPTETIGVKG